jgi:hypothetical protein
MSDAATDAVIDLLQDALDRVRAEGATGVQVMLVQDELATFVAYPELRRGDIFGGLWN